MAAVTRQWTGRSEEQLWDFVEKNLQYVAEHLRDEAAKCLLDGSAPRFAIDDEQLPYIKCVNALSPILLSKLRRLDPFKVEEICGWIIGALGGIWTVTKRSNDGGVDFIGTDVNIVPNALNVPAACKAFVIGQTKRYAEGNIISETRLREFVGAALLRRHVLQSERRLAPLTPVLFAFWTTSDFEPNARQYARDVGLWFMDGHTLATYIQLLNLSDQVHELPDLVSR